MTTATLAGAGRAASSRTYRAVVRTETITVLLAMISSSTAIPPAGRDGGVQVDRRVLNLQVQLDLVTQRISGQGSGVVLDLPDDLAERRHDGPSLLVSAGRLALQRQA